jgi:hypothetical protein
MRLPDERTQRGIVEMYEGRVPVSKIAEQKHVAVRAVIRVLMNAGAKFQPVNGQSINEIPEEELAARCAEIRRRWTPKERRLRMGSNAPQRVSFVPTKVMVDNRKHIS